MCWDKFAILNHIKQYDSEVIDIKKWESDWRVSGEHNKNKKDILSAQYCREILAENYNDYELLHKYGGSSTGSDFDVQLQALLAPTTPVYITE